MKEFAGFKVMKALMKICVPIFDSKQDNIRGAKGQMVGFDENGLPIAQPIPDTGVVTFNSRKGDVRPTTGDYTPQMVGADPAGSAQTVKDELTQIINDQVNALTQKVKDEVDPHIKDKSNPHGVTKEQVGLGSVPNVTTNDQTPTYTQASTLANIASGETLSISMGKIAKGLADLISHIANKSNPHEVTATQIGALPTTGGTITGSLTVSRMNIVDEINALKNATAAAAGEAAKLTTPRTFRTNLGSTATASFDGTANVTPGVTGTLPVSNGGTGLTSLTNTSYTTNQIRGVAFSSTTPSSVPNGCMTLVYV